MHSHNTCKQLVPSLSPHLKSQGSNVPPRRSSISIQDLLCPVSLPSPRYNNLKSGSTTLRGPWHHEEDKLLKFLVQSYGAKNWSAVAAHMRGRTGKQVRERWVNQLDPSLKKKNWSAWEDRTILYQHEKLGNKWSTISRLLPGRTDNAIKNRYNSTLTRVMKENEEFDCVVSRLHAQSDVGGRFTASTKDKRRR